MPYHFWKVIQEVVIHNKSDCFGFNVNKAIYLIAIPIQFTLKLERSL